MKPSEINPAGLSDQELVRTLLDRYRPAVIPPCKVCGQALTPQPMAYGSGILWRCHIQQEDPKRPGYVQTKEGRGGPEEFAPGGHAFESEFLDRIGPGDPLVVELIRRFNAPPIPSRLGRRL